MKLLFAVLLTFTCYLLPTYGEETLEQLLPTEDFKGPFHIESRETRQITFTYNITAETPDERVEKWVVNLPEPPTTGSQTIQAAEFLVKGVAVKWSKNKDASSLHRDFRAAVLDRDSGTSGKIIVTANYTATMYSRRLIAGKSPVRIATLPADEVKAFTASTLTCDYRDAGVQAWIKEHGLTKSNDETELRFASRVFQSLQKLLRYESPNSDADFFRCSRTVKIGKGDCGASNLLFSGILRNAGIPSRVYCGRWIVNPKPGDTHSRGEFFIDDIGWVPVDATAESKIGFNNFGTDSGQYFATSLETDWQIDLPKFGVQKLTWLHQYIVPYRSNGKSTWDGFKRNESFTLTEQ